MICKIPVVTIGEDGREERDLLQLGASLTQRARYTIPEMGPCRNSPVGQTGL